MEEISANDDVLSQNDDIFIAVSRSCIVTDDRSSGPGNETSFELTGTVEIVAEKPTIEKIEEMPKLLKTPEPEKSRKNVKFNLRKSLAWDSAFFISDGVLDADELSTMIEGGEKGVKHQLPGIEEEIYRSMESISTMESDTLESLEAELFDDIRASIQKSNRTLNLNNSSNKLSSGKRDYQPKVSSLSKKVDLDSGIRPAVRIKDNSSTISQPKIITKVNSSSTLTKRASLSANHAKKDQDIAKPAYVTQKGTQGSKITGVIGPRRGVPKPLFSSKSSSLGSSTALKTEPTRPSSSCSNSSSCSSESNVKSSVNFPRKKVDPKTGKLTAGSVPKTPSRVITKNKPLPPANSRLSSHSVSSNHSSSISPASSISEWSSESSSSTSIINRRSTTSRGSIDTGVSYRSSVESASSIQDGIQSVVLLPSQNGLLSRPPGCQPTGLRMPSPKIGFFDGGKSGARTPYGGIRSSGIPKTGAIHCSPNNSNGVKSVKIPPPKTSAAQTNMKLNSHKTTPKPSQEQPTSKTKNKSCPVTSDVSDHKGEPSIQLNEETKIVSCINPSHNVNNDSNEQSNLGNKSSSKTYSPDNDDVKLPKSVLEILSNECFVPSKDNDSNEQSNPGNRSSNKTNTLDNDQVEMLNNTSEVHSNKCFIAVKDNKADKSITDGSRSPFAVKNSVCHTNESGMEVTEKTVNFPVLESQHKENSEVN